MIETVESRSCHYYRMLQRMEDLKLALIPNFSRQFCEDASSGGRHGYVSTDASLLCISSTYFSRGHAYTKRLSGAPHAKPIFGSHLPGIVAINCCSFESYLARRLHEVLKTWLQYSCIFSVQLVLLQSSDLTWCNKARHRSRLAKVSVASSESCVKERRRRTLQT